MKGFTIKLPKQNIDPQGSLKNRILNEVKNRLPFAKWYGICLLYTSPSPRD